MLNLLKLAQAGYIDFVLGMESVFSPQGETLSADTSAVESYRSGLSSLMENEGYTLSQVFNADETGLWWKLMPSKSLVHNGELNFRVMGIFRVTGTPWSQTARITEV